MTGWSFHQLRSFLAYKAELIGVSIIYVDPRNTSRTCNECGHCEKANRRSQSEFACQSCGHRANADLNAAKNIRSLGYVSVPIVTNVDPRALAVAS
jgi:transposase